MTKNKKNTTQTQILEAEAFAKLDATALLIEVAKLRTENDNLRALNAEYLKQAHCFQGAYFAMKEYLTPGSAQ